MEEVNENKVIPLSAFYACKEISLPSELFYVCELGKYLHKVGYVLSLDGIALAQVLTNSKFWQYLRIAYMNGWVVELGGNEAELFIPAEEAFSSRILANTLITEDVVVHDPADSAKRANDPRYAIMTPKMAQTFFVKRADGVWEWSMEGSSVNEEIINWRGIGSSNISQSFVSIIAYVAVHRLFTGEPRSLHMTFAYRAATDNGGIPDIILLTQESSALGNWFTYTLKDITPAIENQLSYYAWWYAGVEMGITNKFHDVPEKVKNAKRLGIGVGSVVALYTRTKGAASDTLKQIQTFNFAVVRGFTARGIVLEAIYKSKPYLTGYKDYKNLPMSSKDMHSHNPTYRTCNTIKINVQWLDLGVERMLCDEERFITPIYEGDTQEIWARCKDGTEERINISSEDLCYWILKDYGIDFDEANYRAMYFRDKQPVYEYYSHDEVPDSVKRKK